MSLRKRLAALRAQLTSQSLEAILISRPHNRRYLSGFTGSAGSLFITRGTAVLATDFRYVEQAKRQAPDFEPRQITGTSAAWLSGILSEFHIQELAFEADDLTVSRHSSLAESAAVAGAKLIATRSLVENMRMVKDAGEVDLIEKAVAIADAAMACAAETIRPGLTELALSWEIECFMRSQGSEALPFDIIVASGPNAALPHAQPSDRPIGRGEPVVIDIGARVGGYTSDLTRTMCAGQPDGKLRKIYDIVLRAQSNAKNMITAGTTGHEADNFARNVIAEAGFGECFGHGLGHGLGLATHEEPRLGPGSKDVLQDNMVFTVEPGIYVPGWGGVRIEDTVIIKNGKITALSRARKELR